MRALLGAAELDLLGARPAQAAEVRATAILGGVKIIVPEGWRISVRGVPILGGFSDETSKGDIEADAPSLTIQGLAFMGGLEITHKRSD